jgi:hypothetical protein
LGHQLIDLFEPRADLRELHSPYKRDVHSPYKRDVQVFGKTIVSEVATFESGGAFEDEQVAEFALTQAG